MEAIPRLPVLCFETKPFYPKNVQFGPDLLNLIRQHYQEDPENYLEEIQQLEKLRQQAAKLNKDVECVATLKRYFCQLHFLQKRFPSLKDISSNNELSWKDLFSSSNLKKIDYRSEFATTLYNIGVLHTQLGASDDRTTEDGLKMACTHFQCAAWAFQYLREITSVNARPDFDHGYLEFVISTCLAQAQECIAEKSISDNRKPSTSAKIVTQICEYYQTAKHGLARLVQEDSIFVDSGVKCPQVNLTYLKYKLPYYRCITNLFLGMQAEEDEKMGERVAYFELAAEEFRKARQHAAEISDYPLNKGLDEAMSFIHDIVEGKLKNAVSENNFIYHEEVPPKDKLQRVKGASLVKCIGFDFNDAEISGPDIFSKLISMKAHVLSSVYSEEKAKLLRSVSASVEEKESELNSFMQSFKLDYLDANDDPNVLPEELIERCAACEAKPTIAQDLVSSMNKLADAHHEVDYMMKEILTLIEEEEKSDEEFQIVMGTNRPPSIVSTELKCEANRYQEALKRATESNESLRDAIAAHVNNIRILSLPLDELEKQLPKISLEYSPEERNVVAELQRLVDKVEEMKNQRALLMLRLRESLRNDDITDRIVMSDEDKSDFSHMVTNEIAKHQEVVNLIEQNLKAQANILKAMTNAYALYAPIRKVISETAHKRGVQINALIESFDVSDDVLQKTSKGLDFYRRLEQNARKLLSRVKGTCKVQEEERLQMYAKTGKKPPSRRRPPPEPHKVVGGGGGVETPSGLSPSPVPPAAAPKLKDYIGRGAGGRIIPKTSVETSLPYNPYYAATAGASSAASAVASLPYVPPPTTCPAVVDPASSTPAYYSTVARPPPVGSENKIVPPANFEPSDVDAKAAAVSASSAAAVAAAHAATVAGYTGYNYAYYGSAATASYQAPTATVASAVTPNSQNLSYASQSVYAGGAYAANNVYAAPAGSQQTYGYGGVYDTASQTNTAAAYAAYPAAYQPNTVTSLPSASTLASKNDISANSGYMYASSGVAHPSAVPDGHTHSYPVSSMPSSTYPAGYQVSGYAIGNNMASVAAPAGYSSGNSSIAYTTSYGVASVTTAAATTNTIAAAPATSYSSSSLSGHYAGTGVSSASSSTSASSAAYQSSSNSYPSGANVPPNHAQTGGYDYSYGITNYLGSGIVDPTNSAAAGHQSFNTYHMMAGYGGHNATSQYSYPNDVRYAPYNTSLQQQQQHQLLQQQQQQQSSAMPDNSTNLTNFAHVPGTYSTSYYTNAGYSVTPSSTVDGRNYMLTQPQQQQQQPPSMGDNNASTTDSRTHGAADGVVAEDAATLYYNSPYGHQQFNPHTTQDRNVDQFVSRASSDVAADATDRLQPKRNSMTYMQAGGAKDGTAASTTSVSSSSAAASSSSSRSGDEKPIAEKKEPSNVDLLADLDFNVSDVPLLPSTPASAATAAVKADDDLSESLNGLSVSGATGTDATTIESSVKNGTLETIVQSNVTHQRQKSIDKLVISNDFTDSSKSENSLASIVSLEKSKANLEAEVLNRRLSKEDIPRTVDRPTPNSDPVEIPPSKPVDPLSSIDALWPLKKEHC